MDNNQNQRDRNRISNQGWSDDNDDQQYDRMNEQRHSTGSNAGNEYLGSSNSGWANRQERDFQSSGAGGYSSGRYGRHYESDLNSGNYGGDRGYGYSSYYGSSNPNMYGAGSGQRGNSYGTSRNLYDRDYEGANRSGFNRSGSNIGAGNYGSYGDRNQNFREDRNYGGYSGSNYGGNFGTNYGYDRNREDRYRNSNEERGWWDRTTDEVSSWFGDEDAERRREQDRRREGMHKGKGPKNYSRSDERIKEDINDRLSDDAYIDASEIDVTVTKGEVTLTGTVDHRSTKRRAEDIAEAVSGVKNVENRIRVGSIFGGGESARGSEMNTTTTTTSSPVPGSSRTRTESVK